MTEQTAPRRVLVAGASGYIGRHVVSQLTALGHQVVALLRRPVPADDPLAACLADARAIICDVTHAPTLEQAVADHAPFDAVVSCLAASGGRPADAWAVDYQANRHLLALAESQAVPRFVLLSALCVQTPMLAFQRAKLAFENRLAESELGWAVIRPTAFFKSLAGQIPRVRQGKPFLLFGRGNGPACIPISEADTARFLIERLLDAPMSCRVWPVGGPGPAVTPRQRGEMLFDLAGLAPRFRRIPIRLLDTAAAGFNAVAPVSRRSHDAAEFARIARFYATQPMLVRDPATGLHSAEATPRFGQDTLSDFYRRVWRDGLAGQELGDQALFRQK